MAIYRPWQLESTWASFNDLLSRKRSQPGTHVLSSYMHSSLSIFRAVRLRVQPVRVGHPNAGAASDPL